METETYASESQVRRRRPRSKLESEKMHTMMCLENLIRDVEQSSSTWMGPVNLKRTVSVGFKH